MNVIPKCLDSSGKYPVYENLPETYAAINSYLADNPLEGFAQFSRLFFSWLFRSAGAVVANALPTKRNTHEMLIYELNHSAVIELVILLQHVCLHPSFVNLYAFRTFSAARPTVSVTMPKTTVRGVSSIEYMHVCRDSFKKVTTIYSNIAAVTATSGSTCFYVFNNITDAVLAKSSKPCRIKEVKQTYNICIFNQHSKQFVESNFFLQELRFYLRYGATYL